MKIKSINIVLEDKTVVKSGIEIESGKIKSFNPIDGDDYSDYYLVPGFIDQHIHGAAGFDAMDTNPNALKNIYEALIKEGTTSFLATTMTMDVNSIIKALDNVTNYMKYNPNCLGVHLEGPFINRMKKGAQDDKNIVDASNDLLDEFNKNKIIKLMTIAPETPNALNVIEYAKSIGIKSSVGHTNANYDQVLEAINKGASQVTHGYNAMNAFSHRDVGVVGAMLLNNKLKAEVICDGVHVSKEAIELLYKNKGKEGIILITDSLRAKHTCDSVSELGGQKVFIKDNKATLKDGTLAGSILKMNEAVKNMVEFTKCSLADAVYMASTNPAKNLSIYDKKGSIEIGKDADLVILDEKFNVIKTIVHGKVLFERRNV